MLKRLMVLGGMLAILLVVAAPAMAQADKYQHTGTGVLGESYTVGQDPTLNYPLTDEARGTSYELVSGFVDLEAYVGQQVTFEGQQVPGLEPGPGEPIPVNVTDIEAAVETPGDGPFETEYAEISGVITYNPEANIPGGEIPPYLITEDGTGDVYMLHSGEVDLELYVGMHVKISGPFQTLGGPLPPDATKVPIAVNSLEVLNSPAPTPEVERVTVTFELTLEEAVSEGRTLGLGYGPIYNTPADSKSVGFCTTDPQEEGTLPACKVGETYSGKLRVPVGVPFSYDFLAEASYDTVRCDFMGPVQVIYSDTQTFTEAATVSATYVEEPLPEGCRAVGEAPATNDQYADEGTPVETPATDGVASDDTVADDAVSDDGVLSVLPDTGGLSAITLALISLLLLSGGGLLAFNSVRR